MDKLKWQIHSETSITQALMWIIMWKLFGGWVGYLAVILIAGNIYTLFKSSAKLGKGYFNLK